MHLALQIKLLVLLLQVVLLNKLGSLDLVRCQQLQVFFYPQFNESLIPQIVSVRCTLELPRLTSQVAAVLQVVDSLADVALAQFLLDETGHHGTDPLFPNNGILGRLESLGVVKVHAVECGGNRGLLALEELGLGSRHDGELVEIRRVERYRVGKGQMVGG